VRRNTQTGTEAFLPNFPHFLTRIPIPVETLTTCNFAGTQSTDVLQTGESDGGDGFGDAGDSVSTQSSETVGKTVEDAVSTIATEIMELDTIGFDETIDLDETEDMSYILDS
jgi:hypothetical protein